jgi:L-seryl-tRNA(Ser) seleniumtransferase
MIAASSEDLRARAANFVSRLEGIRARLVPGQSLVGGGATPEQPLPAWLIAIECADVVEAERRLRSSNPPVVARIEDGRLLLDLRTVLGTEEGDLARVARQACS